MEYEPVIGIEVHTQLDTESKMFCSCTTLFAQGPNHNTCPVCLGLPGVLPVPNRKAVEFVIKTALALNCVAPEVSRFARKNYYYPDLPKAYQISQYELPLGQNGYLEFKVRGETQRVRIHRVHLEEDAGKLIHAAGGQSFVDYNRTGIPLMEIVTEADIHDSEIAAAYLVNLRNLLQYIGVSQANMEKGEMRCEPNISIRPVGAEPFGTKTELKNLNSFKAVQRGIDFEIRRQQDVLSEGGRIVQETRRWDDASQSTYTMRVKERAHDYRYFPDPDLLPIEITSEWLEKLRAEIPELPLARMNRFISELGLSEYDAEVLTSSKALADYYEKVLAQCGDAKIASNWLQTELLGILHESGMEIFDCKISAEDFGSLLKFIKDNTISGRTAKDVFKEMFETGKPPAQIIKEKDLVQVSDESAIAQAVEEVISANPGPAEEFRAGKEKAIGFLVGQVMKATKGKANPQLVNRIIKEKLQG